MRYLGKQAWRYSNWIGSIQVQEAKDGNGILISITLSVFFFLIGCFQCGTMPCRRLDLLIYMRSMR